MRVAIVTLLLLLSLSIIQGGWVQTFADEFNGQTSIDLTKWNTAYHFAPQPINGEVGFYTPDAFSFTSTTVKFLIEERPGFSFMNTSTNFNYTSGSITTLNKFAQTYGYFEMSARMPLGVGFWPAFWLLPGFYGDPYGQEVDILEILTEDDFLHTTYHCDYNKTNPLNEGISTNTSTALADRGFHTYSVQWLPGSLIFYFDTIQVFNWSNNCIPNTPEYILANVAMGGWPKPPNSETAFPNYMEVDYIRAWSYSPNNDYSFGGDVGTGISFTSADASASVGHWSPTGPFTTCTFIMNGSPPVSAIVAGTTLIYNVSVSCSSPLIGGHLQLLASYYNVNLTSLTNSILTVNCSGSCTFYPTLTVPTNTPNGYYIVAFQITTSTWSNMLYAGGVSQFGIGQNYTVGHKYAPAVGSNSNSPVPSIIPGASRSSSASASRSTAASASRSIAASASHSTAASASASIGSSASQSSAASASLSFGASPSVIPPGASSNSFDGSNVSNESAPPNGGSGRLSSWILFY